MPKVSETYTGQYLNATELMPLGQRRYALIHQVTQELVGQNKDAKLVLDLVSTNGRPWPKSCVLNKGNALQLQAAYGDDTDDWMGKRIEIWAENVSFQGRIVPGIKVLPQPSQQPVRALPAAGQGNGAQAPQPAAGPVRNPPVTGVPGDDLDDEIPF
jgi:hypothetical protein